MKIVSGGQTGVDRAALDAAMHAGLPSGGWCPKGRRAEDGPIHERYPLEETPTSHYSERTEWNVRDSDGTLILAWGKPTGGTKLTLDLARRLRKPRLVMDLKAGADAEKAFDWIRKHDIEILNVAGPRESSRPGAYDEAYTFLLILLEAWKKRSSKSRLKR